MEPTRIAAVLLWLAAGLVDLWGLRLIVRGARAAGHPDQSRWVIKGFRRLILGGGLICFGLGLWLDNNALHLLGVTAHQQGDPRRAAELITRACAAAPGAPAGIRCRRVSACAA